MLLNPYNCFIIENSGLFIYFPELNKLHFYGQKRDKDFYFSQEIQTDPKEQYVIFNRQKSSDKLYLKPYFQLKDFGAYFTNANSKSTKIDFFLMDKISKKFFGSSKPESRIISIDWVRKLIRYYGPDERDISIYDVKIPNPIPISKTESGIIYVFEINKASYEHILKEYSRYPEYQEFKKFLFQIFNQDETNPLQNPHQTSRTIMCNPELKDYLIKVGLLNKEQSVEDLLDIINSSELKHNWLENVKSYFEGKVKSFIHGDDDSPEISIDIGCSNLQKIDSRYYSEADNSSHTKYYKFQPGIASTKSLETEQPLKYIYVKINNQMHKIDITKEDLIGASKKCGADNCFKTVIIDGKTYGIRFNQHILLNNTIYFYDTLIEMLINCISWFTLQKLKLKSSKIKEGLPADIQPVNRIGFYKVNIGSSKTCGYISYTVFEMEESTITLYDFIQNILNEDTSIYTSDKIKDILRIICLQIYNFYILMYPSIKFEHNDFKIDNIIINPETLKVSIIDFGLTRINVILNDRNYTIFKREEKEIERATKYSNFYMYIHDIYAKFYLNKQADIERFTLWLKDMPDKKDFKNKANYMNVIRTYFIPNMKILQYLSLDDIKASNHFSYYREYELKLKSTTQSIKSINCMDLFLYSLDELKKIIASMSGESDTDHLNDSFDKCSDDIDTLFKESKLPIKVMTGGNYRIKYIRLKKTKKTKKTQKTQNIKNINKTIKNTSQKTSKKTSK